MAKPGKVINEMWAYTIIDENGDEGIIGQLILNGEWMPLVGADEALIKSLRPMAENIARKMKRPVNLCLFTSRVDVEFIKG